QLDYRRPSDPRADEQDLEAFLDVVQPGWRDVVVKRVFMPHIAGSSALPLAASHGFAGRPTVEIPGLPNVYLAGDWVGRTGLLADAAFASARGAAQLGAMPVPAGPLAVA